MFCVPSSPLGFSAVDMHGSIVRSRHTEHSSPLCSDRPLIADVWSNPVIFFFPPSGHFVCGMESLYLFFFSPNFSPKLQLQREEKKKKLSSCPVLTFDPVLLFKLISSLVKCDYPVAHSRAESELNGCWQSSAARQLQYEQSIPHYFNKSSRTNICFDFNVFHFLLPSHEDDPAKQSRCVCCFQTLLLKTDALVAIDY